MAYSMGGMTSILLRTNDGREYRHRAQKNCLLLLGRGKRRLGGRAGLEEAVAAVPDFGGGDDAGAGAAAIKTQAVALEKVRIFHAADRLVLVGRGVAMDHQGTPEAALPVEEAVVDPGPACLGEDRPGAGQELVGIGMRIEPAMNEQRVAQPDMRAHAI